MLVRHESRFSTVNKKITKLRSVKKSDQNGKRKTFLFGYTGKLKHIAEFKNEKNQKVLNKLFFQNFFRKFLLKVIEFFIIFLSLCEKGPKIQKITYQPLFPLLSELF